MKLAELLKLLNAQHVDYAIIGAYACAAHGHVRATRDIDILFEPSEKNIKKLRNALEKFGYDTTDASLDDFRTKKILFRQYWLALDVHPFATGIETEEALKHKIAAKCEGVETFFVNLDDLIQMKVAAGRPKDKEDLKYLLEIKKQQAV